MQLIRSQGGVVVLLSPTWAEWIGTAADHRAAIAQFGPHQTYTVELFDRIVRSARAAGTPAQRVATGAAFTAAGHGEDVDPDDPSTWPPTPDTDSDS